MAEKTKLTDAVIKNIPVPASGSVEVFDTEVPAFGIRVGKGGARSFITYQRLGGGRGRLRRITLGKYGAHPPAIGLAEARRLARAAKADAGRGIDVTAVKKAERRKVIAATDHDTTFAAIAERFLEYQERKVGAKSVAEYRRTLTAASSPLAAWAKRSIASITKADVLDVLDKLDAKEKRSTANHTLAYLRRFFNWAADRDIIKQAPPTDGVSMPNPHAKRSRALKDDELAIVLRALDDDAAVRVLHGVELPPMPDVFKDFYRVLILSGQRRGEAAGMTFAELQYLNNPHEARWELPGSRTKNGLDHTVPLAPAMVDLLKRRRASAERRAAARAKRLGETIEPPSYVFAAQRFNTPLSGFSKAKTELDVRVAALCEALGRPPLADWTVHDLRRSVVTGMNRIGIDPHVVESVVNHISGIKAGVAGVYNQEDYLPARRAALNAWADHVAALEPTRRT
ncbi:site-specific integrase [Mesorhizobium sp.]|uniref:tyrosine-type recombinase/integrase n=1 Tax=Mesorhizobium sp. TaxID=1871066 RepID=UPI000FE54095|nr:site-specific integrase [Mesorhizobium sp.]RWD70193.1 MAG: site-specific integrase [Mesorhizobium sp.]